MKPGVGRSDAESTASTAVWSPLSRHPRQRTRSPSSHNTARLLAPPAPNEEDKFIWRTPPSRHGPTAGYKVSRVLGLPLQIRFRHRGRFRAGVAVHETVCGNLTLGTRDDWLESTLSGSCR